MANPWLSIPLSDYEAHMGSAEVRQLGALSELFAEALRRCRPETAAILGIAAGNGLEHIDSSVTRRIVGLDANPKARLTGCATDGIFSCSEAAGRAHCVTVRAIR